MDQHTISSMMFCSSIKCLQGVCHASWLQNWKKDVLKCFEAEGGGFLGRTVTWNETWIHYHQLETKKVGKEWRHTSSPKPKKFHTQPSAGKFMLTLFWDKRGVILEHYMPRGNTVTSATYTDLLKNHLRPAIKSKWRGLLSTGVLLQHDNAQPHTARSTVATIQDLSFECLPHPPYSPDLMPSDFHVFGPKVMGGKSFRSDEEVQQAVHEPKDFFSRCIHALPKHWNTCMECNGDYEGKWCFTRAIPVKSAMNNNRRSMVYA